MNEKLENVIRTFLRQASSYGERGLGYDFDEEEINEEWEYFENSAIEEIDNLVETLKM